ncbi:MAG: hypothetical protein ACRBN8_46170 [Nannocystales bacterium]
MTRSSIEIHVSNEEQAVNLHRTVAAMMSQIPAEQLELENRGRWISLDARVPNETGLGDPVGEIPAQFLENSLFVRVVFGGE